MNYSKKQNHISIFPMKVVHAVGARPNFMKIAPIIKEMSKYPKYFNQFLVHTGQHYDNGMSHSFFIDLRLPEPDVFLGVGPGAHGEQTGKIMIDFEKVCIQEKPDLVVVVGDVNSTLACALVAAKLGIPLAHIEAGLRSYDRTMPEEINRILTDHISDFLFTSFEDANINLQKEGISKSRIYFVGNTMIDSLLTSIKQAEKSDVLDKMRLKSNGSINRYALVTIHRPSNVDDAKILRQVLEALNEIANKIKVIFPIHPRTYKQINNFNLTNMIDYINYECPSKYGKNVSKIVAIPPLNYLDFLSLMANSKLVLTDSGGIQEETTILGIPCITLRNNTERPITISQGTNALIGNNPIKIVEKANKLLDQETLRKKTIKYWDGKAAKRIIRILRQNIVGNL